MKILQIILNPFQRIAGWPALLWGVLGMVLATALRMSAQLNLYGLMHISRAYSSEWLASHRPIHTFAHYMAEHLVVWLVPAVLFFAAGQFFSKSRIRFIDVVGTTAFAQLPLIIMVLFYFSPPTQFLLSLSLEEVVNPMVMMEGQYVVGILIIIASLVFLAWNLVWLYQAFRVSCNLSGARLVLLYVGVILCSDLIARLIIGNYLHLEPLIQQF